MRKEAGFDVVNRIRLYLDGNEKLAEIVRRNEETIKHDVLCDDIRIGETGGYSKEWQINSERAVLGVERI
jgi:isoleucyl-tRNA synthetase